MIFKYVFTFIAVNYLSKTNNVFLVLSLHACSFLNISVPCRAGVSTELLSIILISIPKSDLVVTDTASYFSNLMFSG